MSCIDLVIADQPNTFIEGYVQPSLDSHCQHQLIYGKLNISSPTPPPCEGITWDYSKAGTGTIRNTITSLDWNLLCFDLGSEEITEVLTSALQSIFSFFTCQMRLIGYGTAVYCISQCCDISWSLLSLIRNYSTNQK